MSIASEILRLQGVKVDILAAIAAKGVDVPEGSTLADCVNLIGQIGGSPVQEYTYSLLLNWVNNIGPTPEFIGYGSDWRVLTEFVEGMNDPNNSDWSEYDTGNFVSTTPGDRLSDPRNPIDFTSYGITGSTPFGIVSWYNAYDDFVYRYSNALNVNDGKFTIETWFALSPSASSSGTSYLFVLQGDHENFSYFILEMSHNDDKFIFNGALGNIEVPYDISSLGSGWHHYAISSDGDKFYFFVDGEKVYEVTLDANTKAELANLTDYEFNTEGIGAIPFGRFAQIAICSECKWTSNFTPSTTAYVQPS